MCGGVAGQAFEPPRHLDEFADAIVSLGLRAKLGRLLECILERDIELIGDQLGQPVHLSVGQVHGSANVLDRGLGRHGAKGDDLRDVVAAVGPSDVVDYFAAPPHAEVDVDVGQGDALRVQETLEQQAVLQRVHVGDLQRVAHQTARHRAAPRPHRYALRPGVANEVPHDQEVAGEAHLLDHLDFLGEAGLVGGKRLSQATILLERLEMGQAGGEAFADHLFEVTLERVSLGYLEFWEWVADALDLHVTPLGDGGGTLDRVGQLAENLSHLRSGLEVELVSGKLHALRVAHRLAGLDAKQHFLSAGVGLGQIVTVVGGYQRNAGLAREAHHLLIDALFDFYALVLHFEEEVALAEDVAQAVGGFAGLVVAVLKQRIRDLAAEAGRERHQAAAVLGEQFVVDARLVIEAFEEAGAYQLQQVAIAFRVLTEQQQVVAAARPRLGSRSAQGRFGTRTRRTARIGLRAGLAAFVPAAAGDVDLAAYDRLNAARRGLMVEVCGGEQIAVIGDRHGRHAAPRGLIHQLGDFARAIEKTVVGMQMQVDKRPLAHAGAF